MTRIGETVSVPIGSTLTRCGMSEPVRKTACSSTFWLCSDVCLTFGSASTVSANKLAAMRVVTLEDIRALTLETTPLRALCANYRKREEGSLSQNQEGQWLVPLPFYRPNQGLVLKISS